MAICLTASKSSFDAAGNPASIISAASLPSNINFSLEVSAAARRHGEWCRNADVVGVGDHGEDWEMGFLGLMGWKRKWVCGFLEEEPLIKELVSVKICGSSTSPSAFVTKEGKSFPPSRLFKRKKGMSDEKLPNLGNRLEQEVQASAAVPGV
ncbi:hypothetical protein FNV43_RR00088 [Rhamnella rubrinervis]|uniref:Uncharacterized protein n=1 Tax=Rhamnella rubrinervis TaxID=2594499 RepID=A0A8K0HM65_9ROSA|nr:hypothetical protein FNV43_RR00088 [Rhamnella rubrinervis]